MSVKQRFQTILNAIFPAQKQKIEEAEKLRAKVSSSMFIRHSDLDECDRKRLMRDKAYSDAIKIGQREVEEQHANH